MELLGFIFEALLWILDCVVLGGDVHAWFKGKENRIERRAAKRAGYELPLRDRWNRRTVWLTTIFLFLTAGLVAWWWR